MNRELLRSLHYLRRAAQYLETTFPTKTTRGLALHLLLDITIADLEGSFATVAGLQQAHRIDRVTCSHALAAIKPYILRLPDERDSRRKLLCLSPEGHRFVNGLFRAVVKNRKK